MQHIQSVDVSCSGICMVSREERKKMKKKTRTRDSTGKGVAPKKAKPTEIGPRRGVELEGEQSGSKKERKALGCSLTQEVNLGFR